MTTSGRSVREQLDAFCAQVEKLSTRRLFTASERIRLHMTVTLGDSSSMSMQVPDEEDFRSLLLDVRPFLLQKEDIYFNRIANQLQQRLISADLRDANIYNRKEFKSILEGAGAFHLNDRVYRSEDFFWLVTNGEMFHVDIDKEREFQQLPVLYKNFARYAVFDIGLSVAKLVQHQRNIIRKAFSDDLIELD